MNAPRPDFSNPARASRSASDPGLAANLFPSGDGSEMGILRGRPAPGRVEAPAPAADRPLTVSELTNELKSLLQGHFAQLFVEGEISGCRPAASGHVYFTLKDSKAAISCVLWAGQAAKLAKPLRDGDKVEIRGGLDVFPARGTYQIIVQSVRPAGLGRLFLAFQEMKERLEREGLFDTARKRPIPTHPRVVGVVTSPTGAVIRDILKVLGRRAPHVAVLLYPARVQGEGAAQEVARAIARFNSYPVQEQLRITNDQLRMKGDDPEVEGNFSSDPPSSIRNSEFVINNCSSPWPCRPDVLIVGRGGGSLEDLWSFNEEIVARAIYQSEIPVISAVGHETDFTIADFVADLRAPTPSAAAEVVARDSGELVRELAHTTSRLKGALRQRIGFLKEAPHLKARLEGAFYPRVRAMKDTLRAFEKSAALQRPLQRVNEERQRLDDFHQRMVRVLENRQREAARCHERLAAQLSALSPRAVLARGYSITLNARTGKALRSAAEAEAGLPLRIILHEGQLDALAGTAEELAGTGVAPAGASTAGRAMAFTPPPPAPPKKRRTRRAAAVDVTPTPDLFEEMAEGPLVGAGETV